MKNFIIFATIILVPTAFPVSIYADACDNIAQTYQPLITQETAAAQAEMRSRGYLPGSTEYDQATSQALQATEAQMNVQISECKIQETEAAAATAIANTPHVTPIYIINPNLAQPTNSAQVNQVVVTATPILITPTPTVAVYPAYKPSFIAYNTPTPFISPTATPSAKPTATPTKKPTRQNVNFFQNIAYFFENIFHWLRL